VKSATDVMLFIPISQWWIFEIIHYSVLQRLRHLQMATFILLCVVGRLCRLHSSGECSHRYLLVVLQWFRCEDVQAVAIGRIKGKEASHTHYRALDPELIPMYRQSAHR